MVAIIAGGVSAWPKPRRTLSLADYDITNATPSKAK
jgi:hypothetical protein